ncbi:hypothetical protein [Halomonas denitrificans]|uniref:hypothetical protein n=1 Tax=Halomonas denitrificans TaxID=370769 RepID=UPI001300A93D|nr:hypothetical protein [Halomonas denitrificans]
MAGLFALFYGCVGFSKKFGFWDFSLVTGSIFWFFGTIVTVGKVVSVTEGVPRILSFLKWQVVLFFTLTFLMDFYPLSFFWEVLILPVLAFVACLVAVAERDERFTGKPGHTFVLWLQASMIYFVFGASILGLVFNYEKLLSLEGLRSFLMVPVLSLLFLPLLSFMSVYARYDRVFPVYSVYLGEEVSWRLKLKTFVRIRFDYQMLDDWRKHANRVFTLSSINSEGDVVAHLDEFIAYRRECSS